MFIISVKQRYGWRTLNFATFFRSFSLRERKSLVSDAARARIVSSGACMQVREAAQFLEKLEMECLQSVSDYECFLEEYTDSKFRHHVKNRLNELKAETQGREPDVVQPGEHEHTMDEEYSKIEGPLLEAIRNIERLEHEQSEPGYLVLIPETSFTDGQSGQIITIEEFFLDHTPVTNKAYARFIEVTGATPPESWRGDDPPDELLNHPVVTVSLRQAQDYAEWCGCRLPTTAEWCAASRGESGARFPWGDHESGAEYCNNPMTGPGRTTTVDAYPSGISRDGCLDLAGNVWEWTSGQCAVKSPEEGYAWVCGGSYKHSFVGEQGIAATQVLENNSYPYLGFRCAADSVTLN